MHFSFALDSSNIDLWDIDLLDADLDLLDKIFPAFFFKPCLQDVFSAAIFCLPRHLENALQDVFKTSSSRLEDVMENEKLLLWRRPEDVLRTCVEDVFKKSGRPTNVYWDFIFSGFVSTS